MFCACFFFIICQLTFYDVSQPTVSNLFHMTWLQPQRKGCYADFLKVPLTKMRDENTLISPDFAFYRNLLNVITRRVEGK